MFWYPFRGIGGVKMANLEAAVNLEVHTNGTATLGFCTTAAHKAATVTLTGNGQVLFSEKVELNPAKPFTKNLSLPANLDAHDLRASLTSEGKELVAYAPVRLDQAALPPPVTGPPAPAEIKSNEELYLAGQRLEQFHSPSGEPERYWDEALKRDPNDARVNTSLGIREFKEGRFAESEQLFRKAIERLTTNYTSPKDGEPFYYLGLALKAQGRLNEAFDAFFKATWSQAWRSPAYFGLAEIAAQKAEYNSAIDLVSQSLQANELNIRALTLKAALLRHQGRIPAARTLLDLAASYTDPLDVRVMAERWLVGEKKMLAELSATVQEHPATALETAAEYADAGLWSDGTNFLGMAIGAAKDPARVSPLLYYYLAQFTEKLNEPTTASFYRQIASQLPPDYVFPFEEEAVAALRDALEHNPQDARALYYLGNALFDGQPAEAVKLWKQSAAIDPSFAIVHRNLALAYAHQKPDRDLPAAIQELQLAVAAPVKYAAHFTELDELYSETGFAPEQRLALLEQNHEVVSKRDDALSREIGLKVFAGDYDGAIRLGESADARAEFQLALKLVPDLVGAKCELGCLPPG